MRYGSVCSGVEAATVAWHPLGWEPQWFSEIEKFPSAVLANHYPNVPNLGDMTKIHETETFHDRPIDLLVGGTPCQSFSVAGLRKGMADPRGNLALVYLALAARKRPRWIVWENVPGVLSSNGGRDFGAFLGGLAELGYGFCYRVLDAQYFGVAQRRRRVFVVGYLGDWRPAAAVLFEPHGMQGHPAPRRQAGPAVAALTANGVGTCGADDNQGQAGHLIAFHATQDPIHGPISPCLGGNMQVGIAHTLRGEGFDASEDGTGRAKGGDIGGGTETLIPDTMPTMRAVAPNGGKGHGARNGDTKDEYIVAVYPINTQVGLRVHKEGDGTGLGIGNDGDPAYTLQAAHHHAVAHTLRGEGFDASEYGTGRGIPLVPATFDRQSSGEYGTSPVASTVSARDYKGVSDIVVNAEMSVRRLTPRECERLQGFPDDYTLIHYRGKPSADGPRYKAMGNSMAVPVMRWIGERIQKHENGEL